MLNSSQKSVMLHIKFLRNVIHWTASAWTNTLAGSAYNEPKSRPNPSESHNTSPFFCLSLSSPTLCCHFHGMHLIVSISQTHFESWAHVYLWYVTEATIKRHAKLHPLKKNNKPLPGTRFQHTSKISSSSSFFFKAFGSVLPKASL